MSSKSAYDRANDAAKAKYGPDAEVLHKMVGGKSQCWVGGIGNGEAVVAGSYRDLAKLLTRTPVAPSVGQEEIRMEATQHTSNLIDAKAAAHILGVTVAGINGIRERGALASRATQSGKGGKRYLYEKADVEALIGKVRGRSRARKPRTFKPGQMSAAGKAGWATRRAKQPGVAQQTNIRNIPDDHLQRAEALALKIRTVSTFTQGVTASQVLREAISIGLTQLEKEHAKR